MDKKKPDLRLNALYVTPAGAQPLKVQPKKGVITVDGVGSWQLKQESMFPKGAGFDVILPYNSSVALPWASPVKPSPEAYDEALHNSYREQVDRNAKGSNTKRVAWVSLSLNIVTILVVIIVGFVVSGQVDDLFQLVHQLHQQPGAGEDVTRVSTGG